MRRFLFFVVVIFFVPAFVSAQSVVSIAVDGTVNPASAGFIEEAITKAANQNAECLIIHLNTPGGLLKSTRVIVTSILESPVPVVIYISPGGAHAGSAGVFLTMAAHIAAMAPGTNIGAAHPVSTQGGLDTTMNEKITNDAAAFIRTIAEKRKRNITWAEEAVRRSVSVTEEEALENNIIDLIATSERELLAKIDGKTVETAAGTKTLRTKNASVTKMEMSALEKFLDMISDPNLAYILMMIGFYGLLFELYSPGAIFPGIVGVISLILAFYAMHTLPVNYAGLALILFGIVLFLLEIKIISHGMLAIGGVVSLLLGSFFLFRAVPGMAIVRISLGVILTTTSATALFFLFVIGMGLRAQRAKPVSGIDGIIGKNGEALVELNPSGIVNVLGETWNAESVSGTIDKGMQIRVTGINGLKLFVKKKDRTETM